MRTGIVATVVPSLVDSQRPMGTCDELRERITAVGKAGGAEFVTRPFVDEDTEMAEPAEPMA